MKITRLAAGVAVVVAGALALSACTPPRESEVIKDTAITVSWNDTYYALNDGLSDTNATANSVVNYMLKSGFKYYNASSELIKQTDFGTYAVTSEDPLTVKYTVNEGVKWSDGAAVDAADLLLYWAANTTQVQNGEGTTDKDGNLTDQSGTFWNTGAQKDYGLDLVKDVPTIGDDGRSLTLTYSKYFVDWELAFDVAQVSAHGTTRLAYPGKYKDDADGQKQAKADFIKAVQNKDLAWLSPVSKSFNQDYKFSSGTPTGDGANLKLLTNGAYRLTEINANQGYTTLTANPDYKWGPSPKYEKITVRVIPQMADQITALQNGEVQIASGQPTADIAQLLQNGVPGVKYTGAPEGTYEHIDLQVANGGAFDPATYGGDADKALKVRQAFMKILPRQEILDKLIKPLQPNAELRESQIFLPGTDGAKKAAEVNGYKDLTVPDVEGAKKLLAEVGATNPTVRMLFSSTNERRKQEFALIQPYAAQAGFNLVDASSPTWSPDLRGKPTSYDAALFGWQSTSTAVGESAANYQPGGQNNFYGWDNPQITDLFTQLSQEKDKAKQQDLQVQAEKLIGEQYWSVPIFQFPGITAWSDKVDGVSAGFLNPTYFWNFWEWAPAKGATPAS